jgi:hypothetical protein
MNFEMWFSDKHPATGTHTTAYGETMTGSVGAVEVNGKQRATEVHLTASLGRSQRSK